MENLDTYKQNLFDVWERVNGTETYNGLYWYDKARNICLRLSYIYEQPLFKVVGVLSALSPRNKWDRNIQDTENLLLLRDKATVATFNNNKEKALRILDANSVGETIKILNGNKTISFFKNIYYVEDENVTLDVWALRILGYDKPSTTDKQYKNLSNVFKELAEEINIQPKQLQAITWVAYRDRLYQGVNNG